MKTKILFPIFLFISGLFISYIVSAQTPGETATKTLFPPVNWISKDSNDEVTIQNGSGTPLLIQINVNKDVDTDLPGINIKNCGTTTHIKSGSVAVCFSQDPTKFVSFSSDSQSSAASGMYQIKQQ